MSDAERDKKILEGLVRYSPETGMIIDIPTGMQLGTETKQGYIRVFVAGKNWMAHRIGFLLHYGWLPDEIDHINNDKADNRIVNLRPATHGENQHNRKPQRNNSSGVKGVHWSKWNKKWVAKLMVNRKQIHLGNFDDLELAELVIQEAREKYHGQFAHH